MIKVIAFDLVGVLVKVKDIKLTNKESKLERLFGDNYSDLDYIKASKEIINNELNIIKTTKGVINKLYEIKHKDLFKIIKEKYNIKIIIATNHVSYVKEYILNNLDNNYLDDIIISAEINKIKPNKDFYNYILNKHKIKPQELLFLDDKINNINGAKELGINTIKVDKETELLKEIEKYM